MSSKLSVSFLLFILPLFTFSQKLLQGTVKDVQKEPIAFANVLVLDHQGTLITGTVTDEKGTFELRVKDKTTFKVKISFIGFVDWEKDIREGAEFQLGTILLNEASNELETVVVTAKKPTIKRKVDRLVFSIENSIVASGGDAMDVLQKTPGVRVDGSSIGLIGKSAVRVLINGRISPLSGEDLASYLRTLSSDEITKIEVITNPPAKYEAEGNSGLINIVLKRVKRDYLGGNVRSTYRQATYASGFLGSGITYQKDKLALFANVNSGLGAIEVNETNKIYYAKQTWDTDTDIKYHTKFLSGRAGIDYDLGKNATIGIQYLGATSRPNNDEVTNTTLFNTSRAVDSLLATTAASAVKTYYHSMNAHFKADLDTLGRNVSIDVDYFTYHNKQERNNTTDTYKNGSLVSAARNRFKNASFQNPVSFTARLDVAWPSSFANYDFGTKISHIKSNSDVKAFNFKNNAFVIDNNQSNIFEYRENTQAVYASASKSINKWDFKVGLRWEFTQTEGNSLTLNRINKNHYNKVFPTAYITHNPNDNHSLSLSYGKRINRPSYGDLNPFRWYSNPFSYTEGNPFLQPSFTDNFEVSHTYKNNLNTSLYASITENGQDQITLTTPNSTIQATVRRNFLEQYAFGVSQSYTLKPVNWMESYIQYDLNYSKISSQLPNTINAQTGFNFYTGIDNSFQFNTDKTFLGEFNLWYSSPGVSGVDYITESYAVDLGLKGLFLNKDLQVKLVVSDVFKTNRNTIRSVINGIRQEYSNYYDNRQLVLSATYRFGNKKLRSKRKQFSNEEERRRAN